MLRGDNLILAFLVGILIYIILRIIPFIGGLIGFVVLLLGLGAIVKEIFFREEKK